ncbi:hypothetical protein [Ulvibacter litoralis]|uniref:Uncharacterized protein n=1 Tax=Ulvibacter litoralis TaxID=227084 RepID=A0A1G7DKI2_9FLAO|nr:hypothetical protein [Ulvibacter litoralis]GHC43234.1 hypothetical protein GCM10008083_01980 [Ulvibacter litoralis]SDE51560.1 hypothetical protein SAMN05421855_1011014 [Ulvibacter litoralis]
MKKNVALTIMAFFAVILTHAQEEVLSFKIEESNYLIKNKDAYSLPNSMNGDLALVLVEKKTVYAKLFDKNFQFIKAFETDALKSKYNNFLDYKVIGNKYYLLASNNSYKKFAVLSIDFDKQQGESIEVDFQFDNEKFLETVRYNNQPYIISATTENAFILRTLNNDLKPEILHTVEIGDPEKDQKLLARKSHMFFAPIESNITKIDNRVPVTIEQAASKTKLYQNENKIYLTFDDDEQSNTSLFILDLKTLELSTHFFKYPEGRVKEFARYNSFILDNNIIQLGSNKEEMKIEVKNFDGEIIKEYYLEKEVPIAIKNSPIIQEGGTAIPFVNRREMEETSKFLRKVSSGKLGITIYETPSGYTATIGGYKIVANNGGGMMMMGGGGFTSVGNTGVGGMPIMVFNPTFYSYNMHEATKSTFFNTHFDKDFNYVKKEVEVDVFDKIEEYKKDIDRITAEDVFFHNNNLYFGYFNMRDKYYRIIKM